MNKKMIFIIALFCGINNFSECAWNQDPIRTWKVIQIQDVLSPDEMPRFTVQNKEYYHEHRNAFLKNQIEKLVFLRHKMREAKQKICYKPTLIIGASIALWLGGLSCINLATCFSKKVAMGISTLLGLAGGTLAGYLFYNSRYPDLKSHINLTKSLMNHHREYLRTDHFPACKYSLKSLYRYFTNTRMNYPQACIKELISIDPENREIIQIKDEIDKKNQGISS